MNRTSRFAFGFAVLASFAWAGAARADFDPHAEMAVALEGQADLLPAAAASAVKRGIAPRPAGGVARAATTAADAANQVSQRAQGQAAAQAQAHQAQAAAAAAAGQAQSQAAGERASRPHRR